MFHGVVIGPGTRKTVSYTHLLSAFFSQKKCPVIYPYARYEYYNPQEEAEGSATMEKRCQVSKWTAGVNWFALPNLVVKADYTRAEEHTSELQSQR